MEYKDVINRYKTEGIALGMAPRDLGYVLASKGKTLHEAYSIDEYDIALEHITRGGNLCAIPAHPQAARQFVVLDFDLKTDARAYDLLKDHLPDTLITKTKSGGYHYWYSTETGSLDTQVSLFNGLDLLVNHNVVMAPSVIEGKKYIIHRDTTITPGDEFLPWLKKAGELNLEAEEGDRNRQLRDLLYRWVVEHDVNPTALEMCALLIGTYNFSPSYPVGEITKLVHATEKKRKQLQEEAEAKRKRHAELHLGLTDYDVVQAILAFQGDRLSYISDQEKWARWDEDKRRWNIDKHDIGAAEALEEERIRRLETVKQLDDPEYADTVRTHTKRMHKAGPISSITNLLKKQREVHSVSNDWDGLNTRSWVHGNGRLYSLEENEERPTYPEDRILQNMGEVDFRPSEPWVRFLKDITQNNVEYIRYLKLLAGYWLSGFTFLHEMYFLYGSGRNGKSTFIEVLQEAFGDYSTVVNYTSIQHTYSSGIPNDIAGLKGKRFAAVLETPESMVINGVKIKSLSGGDRLAARHLYGEWFVFQPFFKMVISVNHLPRIPENDRAMWSRIVVLPFDAVFETPNYRLVDQLKADAAKVRGWAIQGAREFYRLNYVIEKPKVVKYATFQYKSSEDVLGEFIQEHCEVSESYYVPSTLFYKLFIDWAKDNGHTYEARISKQRLYDRLRAAGFGKKAVRMEDGKTRQCITGVKLTANSEQKAQLLVMMG